MVSEDKLVPNIEYLELTCITAAYGVRQSFEQSTGAC